MEQKTLTKTDYMKRIAWKIKGYHKHLGKNYHSTEHVQRWIEQFPEEEQEIVLRGTDLLLSKNYVNEKRMEKMFEALWKADEEIMGDNPLRTLNHTQFLDIQSKGNSQKRLVEQIEKYYKEKKSALINKNNHKKVERYIYLDDCVYTGYTVLKDITNWIENGNPNPGAELDIITWGVYTGMRDYIQEQLDCICQQKNIRAFFYFVDSYRNSIGSDPQPYDILWPQKVEGDPYVDAYIRQMEEKKKTLGRGGISFRKEWHGEESPLFVSTEERVIFEKALLKKGAYICSLPKNPNEKMKPMGYAGGISLGFGAFFATDYNISNNCPLAFWWGSTDPREQGVLRQWYPLLEREVNQTV
ncbi:MAG: hypothetical protein PUF59_06575 [Lachnospiraceae bacterium]|nr:hypothetical protein [Lachnospiraceae bacterium]